MGKKSSKAPAPDPAIGQAALENAAISKEWLDFSREQFAAEQSRLDELQPAIKGIMDAQIATQQQGQEWAAKDRERYETVYQPLEDEFIEQAQGWDSPERQAKQAAEAKADVTNNAALQQQARQRTMAAQGVNPASGRYAGVERAGDLQTALAGAGAENNARNTVRSQGMTLKADAVNMGKGMAAQAAGGASLGLQAGGAAMGTMGQQQGMNLNAQGIMGSGYQGAIGGNASAAGILNQQYGNQLSAWATQEQANSAAFGGMMSGLGSMAGMAMMSSKDVKENKKPVKGALEAVDNLDIEAWDYKPGAGDGGRHVGAYAEDFQRETGLGDGKGIGVIDAIGVTMKSVQELNEKVDKIASKKGGARG